MGDATVGMGSILVRIQTKTQRMQDQGSTFPNVADSVDRRCLESIQICSAGTSLAPM